MDDPIFLKTNKAIKSSNLVMQFDYNSAVNNLKNDFPFINSIAIVENNEKPLYLSEDWDITEDLTQILSSWSSKKVQSLMILGEKYLKRQFTEDRLVFSSTNQKGHILGVKDEQRILLVQIEQDGIIPFATTEMVNLLASIRLEKPYLVKKPRLDEEDIPLESKELSVDKPSVPFTARLMAYYRFKECNREKPLIIDPFAEKLAGDLNSFLEEHIRYSEMDYPFVRSYFIENKLLTPWCNTYRKSQVVLLGAGLDTRAYRFMLFKNNSHVIYEIDYPVVISYKEEILRDDNPLCKLIRLPIDLAQENWASELIDRGFSTEIPTFWILEGLVYYIKKDISASLLRNLSKLSSENSEIFVDIMHQSRWVPHNEPLYQSSTDPFAQHFKWGLDIKLVPSFFAENGWEATCSFADDHDQGRNVGQKAMIFIHGEKIK